MGPIFVRDVSIDSYLLALRSQPLWWYPSSDSKLSIFRRKNLTRIFLVIATIRRNQFKIFKDFNWISCWDNVTYYLLYAICLVCNPPQILIETISSGSSWDIFQLLNEIITKMYDPFTFSQYSSIYNYTKGGNDIALSY